MAAGSHHAIYATILSSVKQLETDLINSSISSDLNMMKSSSQSSLTTAKLDYSRSSISSSSPIDLIPSSKIWKLEYLFGGCMRAAKKTLQKCLSFLVPSSHPTLRCSRSVSFSKSTSTRGGGCKDSARSSSASNATAAAASASNMQWCRSNADISIYDAIVHCKKSIGQS